VKPLYAAQKAIEMVIEPKKTALPDMYHVVGCVGMQKAPIEDGDPRYGYGYELVVYVS
jgi:hypothetical protein